MKITLILLFLIVLSTSSQAKLNRRRSRSLQTNNLDEPNIPSRISSASLGLEGNQIKIDWINSESTAPCLTYLIFSQPSKEEVQYTAQEFSTSFLVEYHIDFAHFEEGNTKVQIDQAFSCDEGQFFSDPYFIQFQAIRHHFSEIHNNTQVSPFPLKVSQGQNIIFNGKSRAKLDNLVILLTPNYKFIHYHLNTGNTQDMTVPANFIFNLNIPFPLIGTYIFEINDATGGAVINTPIYVGGGYPLIPDDEDLRQYSSSSKEDLKKPQSLEQRRKIVLNLINIVRQQFGVSPVTLEQPLNLLSQYYANKMIIQKFFAHVDPQGSEPWDRAEQVGIFNDVGENLSVDQNLTMAQLGLERSNGHLENMVMGKWTKVGLGIDQNQEGSYYLVQTFSCDCISNRRLLQYEREQKIESHQGKLPQTTGLKISS